MPSVTREQVVDFLAEMANDRDALKTLVEEAVEKGWTWDRQITLYSLLITGASDPVRAVQILRDRDKVGWKLSSPFRGVPLSDALDRVRTLADDHLVIEDGIGQDLYDEEPLTEEIALLREAGVDVEWIQTIQDYEEPPPPVHIGDYAPVATLRTRPRP